MDLTVNGCECRLLQFLGEQKGIHGLQDNIDRTEFEENITEQGTERARLFAADMCPDGALTD